MMPQAGSAYSYAYGIFGELAAWIIGWDLILEYGMGAATVAAGWSFYLQDLLRAYGLALPPGPPARPSPAGARPQPPRRPWSWASRSSWSSAPAQRPHRPGPGHRQAGGHRLHPGPGGFLSGPPTGPPDADGAGSIIQAASLVFFAFLGFDVVAITAEESRHPERDVPFGIIGSLGLCSLIYLAAALTLVGMVSYTQINPDAPFSTVFRQVGLPWAGGPGGLRRHHRHHQRALHAAPGPTPGALRHGPGRPPAPGGGDAPSPPPHPPPHDAHLRRGRGPGGVPHPHRQAGFLCNIGTLFAFFLVCLGVLVLRITQPTLPRPFRCPAGKLVAAAGALVCLALMLSMPAGSWLRLFLWLGLGLAVYFLYAWRTGHLGGNGRELVGWREGQGQ